MFGLPSSGVDPNRNFLVGHLLELLPEGGPEGGPPGLITLLQPLVLHHCQLRQLGQLSGQNSFE